jgi:hypothetical protein
MLAMASLKKKRPYYCLMTLTYQRSTAVLLLMYGNFFPSGIYYCLRVVWCAAARMSELELEQRTKVKLLERNISANLRGQCYEENSSLQVGETFF